MNERLRVLRNAVLGRGREVEVTPEGEVRELTSRDEEAAETPPVEERPTKLAPRTFGL